MSDRPARDDGRIAPPCGTMLGLSRAVMRAETLAGGALVGAMLLLLVANVGARAAGQPLIWADELAVHLMVWLAFIGASLGIAGRSHMTIGLLPEALAPRMRLRLAVAVDGLVIVFLLAMAVLVWRWLDPPGLIRAGSAEAFARESFNFVYLDPTLTLGLRKIWFWLILPVTCLTGLLHALAVLAADLALLRGLR